MKHTFSVEHIIRIQNILLGFSLAFSFLFPGCYTRFATKSDIESPKSLEYSSSADTTVSVSVIEGTVIFFDGGGTREMPYPSGYILTNLRWLTNVLFPVNRIYLDVLGKPTWLYSRVKITGKLRTVILTGSPSNYIYSIVRMKIDTLEIIE